MIYVLACRQCLSTCQVRGDLNVDQNTIDLDAESLRVWLPKNDCAHRVIRVIGAVREEYEGGPIEPPR